MVSKTSGTVVTGGSRLIGPSKLDGFDMSNGSFYPPTVVVDVDLNDELWKNEVFGPLVVIQKFRVRAPRFLKNWNSQAERKQERQCWCSVGK